MAALHLIRDRSAWDLERRQRGALMRALLDGDVPPDAATQLGIDSATGITVLALRVAGPRPPRRPLGRPRGPHRAGGRPCCAVFPVVPSPRRTGDRWPDDLCPDSRVEARVRSRAPDEQRDEEQAQEQAQEQGRRAGPLVAPGRRPGGTCAIHRAGVRRCRRRLHDAVTRRHQLVAARGRSCDSRPRRAPRAIPRGDRNGARRVDPAHAAGHRPARSLPPDWSCPEPARARRAPRDVVHRDAVGLPRRLRPCSQRGAVDLRSLEHVPVPPAAALRAVGL